MHHSVFRSLMRFRLFAGVALGIVLVADRFIYATPAIHVARRAPPARIPHARARMPRHRLTYGARRGGIPPQASQSGRGRLAMSC